MFNNFKLFLTAMFAENMQNHIVSLQAKLFLNFSAFTPMHLL